MGANITTRHIITAAFVWVSVQQCLVDELGEGHVLVEMRLDVEIEGSYRVALLCLLLPLLFELGEVSFVCLLQLGFQVLLMRVLAACQLLSVVNGLLLNYLLL